MAAEKFLAEGKNVAILSRGATGAHAAAAMKLSFSSDGSVNAFCSA